MKPGDRVRIKAQFLNGVIGRIDHAISPVCWSVNIKGDSLPLAFGEEELELVLEEGDTIRATFEGTVKTIDTKDYISVEGVWRSLGAAQNVEIIKRKAVDPQAGDIWESADKTQYLYNGEVFISLRAFWEYQPEEIVLDVLTLKIRDGKVV